jgi:hypothetical protein
MGSSSFLNAFRLLAKKPVLLLLLLPLQFALPLVSRLMPMPDIANGIGSSSEMMMNGAGDVYLYLFGMYGITLVLYLLAGFFLIPPAMELLHEGANSADTPAGWYGRGLKKHWWKPVTFGAMQTGIMFVLGIMFYLIILVIMFISLPGLIHSSLRYQDDGIVSSLLPVLGAILIPLILFALIYMLIYSFFAMLLPASADRGFGAAFKVLFSGYGFKKVMKVYGVYLLTSILSIVICFLLMLGYSLVMSMASFREAMDFAASDFTNSWVFYGVSVVLSFIIPFRYAYIFCVFQEIKNREANSAAALLRKAEPIGPSDAAQP